jgi:cobalt-zinc-cadmium efflux system membrane fusion protein
MRQGRRAGSVASACGRAVARGVTLPANQESAMSNTTQSVDVMNHSPSSRWRSLVRGVPTVLVIVLLGAVAWAGHHTGWRFPAFASVLNSRQKPPDDWCEEHGVPESECVECNPALFSRPKQYGFCPVHGVHQCPLEHPEVAQVDKRPVITQTQVERAERALKFKDWPENNPGCKQHQRLLQFASAAAFDKMGIDVRPVMEKSMAETVPASGELTFEQPRVTSLYTLTAGRVWQVTSAGVLGAQVKKGDVLALVDALEVGKAKTEFLQAFAQLQYKQENLTRLTKLYAEGSTSERNFRDAEAAWREANIRYLAAQQVLVNLGLPINLAELKDLTPEQLASRLPFLGLSPESTRGLNASVTTANLLPVVASRDGTVIEVKVALGDTVEPSKTLFVVADTSRMWLMLNVRQEDAKYIKVADPATNTAGNKVLFKPDGGGSAVQGEIVFRSKVLDEKTRTLTFRADVKEPPSTLAAHTFGKAQIIIRAEPNAIVVPSESVHWEGDCHVVFVRDKNWFKAGSPKVYHVRTVRPGVMEGGYTEIMAGLLPGEVVAAKNSTALRAELLKNNLGAG